MYESDRGEKPESGKESGVWKLTPRSFWSTLLERRRLIASVERRGPGDEGRVWRRDQGKQSSR